MDSKLTRRLASLVIASAVAGGCMSMPQANVVSGPPTQGQTPDRPQRDDVDFWNRIDHVPIVSNADAVYAMSLYEASRGGALPSGDYAGRIAALRSRDLLPRGFQESAGAAVDRGTLARFVAVALKLPRGLTASIVGLNGRYAVRELEFRGLLPSSSPNQIVTGSELIGVLSRAEDYEEAMIVPSPGVAAPNGANAPAGTNGLPSPTEAAPVAARPLPDITLVSRSLDTLMLDLDNPPASAPAAVVAGDAFTVGALTGSVLVQPPGATAFIPATVGMQIAADTEISTGMKGSMTLNGPNKQMVSFKKLTRTTLRKFTSDGGVNVTRVDMQRGTTGAEIDNTPVEGAVQKYDLQVQSPRSTLAIKGTRVALYDQQPYDVEARSFTGTAVFEDFDRRKVAFGRKNGGLVAVRGNNPDPTSVALQAAVEDPGTRDARSDSEADLISNYFSRNTTIRFDRFTQLPTITGGTIPSPDGLRAFFNGKLSFGIEWTGNTNLNIDVLQPNVYAADGTTLVAAGKAIYPYGKLARDVGGFVPFDHRGGPNGGFEVANLFSPIDGRYDLFAQNLGNLPANVKFFAFEGATRLPLYEDFSFAVPGNTVFPVIAGNSNGVPISVYVGQNGPPGGGGIIIDPDLPIPQKAKPAKVTIAAPVTTAAPSKAGPPAPMTTAKAARKPTR